MALSDALTAAEQLNMLSDWVSASTTGAKVILFTNDIVPTPQTTYSALVQPPVGGGHWYAPVDLNYQDPILNGDGSISVRCQSVQFNYGDSTDAPVVVYGWGAANVASNILLHASNLPNGAVNMGALGDGVITYPGFRTNPVTQSLS